MPRNSRDVPQIRLTGRAWRYVQLLRDFGHLDDAKGNELFSMLSDLAERSRIDAVDLPAVQRITAVLLFGRGTPEEVEAMENGLLAEDWPILFS